MTPPASTPPPELAAAVRSGRWEEVRAAAAVLPRDLPPAVALAAAMAERQLGQGERALALLDAALPDAGTLAPALRLEAAEVAAGLGRDPLPYLSPLLARGRDATHRQAAAEALRQAWESLPVSTLRAHRRAGLERRLRRDLDAVLAVRNGARAEVVALLESEPRDRAALHLARWVDRLDRPTADEALLAAEALLANGWWREAEALLARCPAPATPGRVFRKTYLEARAAYRLGRYTDAAMGYDRAIALATAPEELFDAAVQRARVAELEGDWPQALGLWQRARLARPGEGAGWEGSARLLAALGRPGEAVALARAAPAQARRVFGPRLAATLLARRETDACREVLALLPGADPAARTVGVAAALAAGDEAAARTRLAALLADRHAGAWRDLALALLPPATAPPAPAPAPTADPGSLAVIACAHGLPAARRALAESLGGLPAWRPLLSSQPLPDPTLAAPVAELTAAGLEPVAARLYATAFPGANPTDLAWSARRLAAWGNLPAALSAGEQLWRAAGEPPASLLPEPLLPHLAPPELTSGCVAAAAAESLPASWLAAVVRRESRFAAGVRSPAGALGIAQIVPETARSHGAEPGDVLDPEVGLRLAARELARLRRLYQGRLTPAAAAYNAGGGVVAAWLNLLGEDATEVLFATAVPYGETSAYVRAVHEGAQLFRHLDTAGHGPAPAPADTGPSPGAPDQRK